MSDDFSEFTLENILDFLMRNREKITDFGYDHEKKQFEISIEEI